jgi:hypothetical protein
LSVTTRLYSMIRRALWLRWCIPGGSGCCQAGCGVGPS